MWLKRLSCVVCWLLMKSETTFLTLFCFRLWIASNNKALLSKGGSSILNNWDGEIITRRAEVYDRLFNGKSHSAKRDVALFWELYAKAEAVIKTKEHSIFAPWLLLTLSPHTCKNLGVSGILHIHTQAKKNTTWQTMFNDRCETLNLLV